MLYQIKEENGKFKLFFSKKTGPKFKKAFPFRLYLQGEWVERRAQVRQGVEQFVERYLRQCCAQCKERGWVYKTRGSGGTHGGGASHGKGNRGGPHWGKPPAGTIVFCPECRARHVIGYEQRMILGLLR